ncbi:MAG TPA: hypothetical protein PK250_09090 [Syntrophobacter fumaroxidans]|nr:hypothetical protein [Syntrophobacter fumaroxidans]
MSEFNRPGHGRRLPGWQADSVRNVHFEGAALARKRRTTVPGGFWPGRMEERMEAIQ